jgi:hypothetical protein
MFSHLTNAGFLQALYAGNAVSPNHSLRTKPDQHCGPSQIELS